MNAQKDVAILVTRGGLLDAYPPLNLALAAAAMEANVTMFFTFDGIKLLLAKDQADLAPAGTEAAEAAKQLAAKQVPSVPELLTLCRESGVKLIACQATLDLLDLPAEQLGPDVEVVGAATFLALTMKPETTTFTF